MKLTILIIFLFLSPIAYGTSISGTVYDFSLNRLTAKVSIDTTPRQIMIAENGSFHFFVPLGNYTLIAERFLSNELVEGGKEEILIRSEGEFTVDMILLPELDAPSIDSIDEIDVLESSPKTTNSGLFMILLVVGIIILSLLMYYWYRSTRSVNIEPEFDATGTAVLDFIKAQEGRTTQLDIRNKFPSSEAKISLILTELEAAGKIKKIKKGRGNIIVLVHSPTKLPN